jgi:hypothetical protein
MPRNSANQQSADEFPDGLTFYELMERAQQWNDAHPAPAPEPAPEPPVEGGESGESGEPPVEGGESGEPSTAAAAASSSSGDVVAAAASSAYTGSTSVIVKESFSKIKNTMRAMCWCPMCNKFVEPEKMVSGCELPDGQRMASDDKVPPCMICDGCARKDAHKSGKKDGNGNSYCKACPKTVLFFKSLYESRGEELPRHLAIRKNIAKHRCQPCGNSAYLKILQDQVAELQESYTAERLQHDRTQRRLAARIEMHEKNASGQPAASHEDREERRRQIRAEESGTDPNAGAAAEEAVVEGAGKEGDDAMDGAELFGEEDEELVPASAAVPAAGGAPLAYRQAEEQLLFDAMDDGEVAAAADGNSEVGEDASRATGVAAARCEGGEGGDGDDDDEDDEPLSNRGQAAKKRRVGGSTAVRSAAAPAAARSNAARKRPMTAVQAAAAAAAAADDDSSDDEGGEGGATGPVDEAERQAINYKCPRKLVKKYRQFLQTGKSTADWIAHLEVEKTEAEATKVSNKDKLKNYDAMVKERDQAKARAEAEAKSKKKAVQEARKQGAEKLKVYSNTIQQCMALLRHLGVADEDVERLANESMLAEALFEKYPVTEAGNSAAGAADTAADTAAAEAEGAGEA